MVSQWLWSILVGVLSGIISSFIVSKVFFIQSEYQDQLNYLYRIIRKLDSILTLFEICRGIFKTDYDQELEMHKEMREKGYKTEEEYYSAHKDRDWISKDEVIKLIKKEIDDIIESLKSDIINNQIKDTKLNSLLIKITTYMHSISSSEVFCFSNVEDFINKGHKLIDLYNQHSRFSWKTLFKYTIRNKTVIVLLFIVVSLIAGAITTSIFAL